MKKTVLILALIAGAFTVAFAQSDKIFKHTGETVEGTVLMVDEYAVIFRYANEDADQLISKYAIEKIVYGKSGREEKISDKITVNSKADWEKVVILVDKSEIAGLKKSGEVRGKTSFINFHTPDSGDKKAEKKLKEAAAALGCPFVFLTMEKTINVSDDALGGNQDIKKGQAYKYM